MQDGYKNSLRLPVHGLQFTVAIKLSRKWLQSFQFFSEDKIFTLYRIIIFCVYREFSYEKATSLSFSFDNSLFTDVDKGNLSEVMLIFGLFASLLTLLAVTESTVLYLFFLSGPFHPFLQKKRDLSLPFPESQPTCPALSRQSLHLL